MKVYTYSSSGVQKQKMHKYQMYKYQIFQTKCTNFVRSRQISFGVDKKISTTQNAHCLLPSTTTTTTTTTTTGTHTTY